MSDGRLGVQAGRLRSGLEMPKPVLRLECSGANDRRLMGGYTARYMCECGCGCGCGCTVSESEGRGGRESRQLHTASSFSFCRTLFSSVAVKRRGGIGRTAVSGLQSTHQRAARLINHHSEQDREMRHWPRNWCHCCHCCPGRVAATLR